MVKKEVAKKEKTHKLQDTALAITGWVGSPQSIVVHSLAFLASFAAVAFGLLTFDRMLLVLTTVLSLEAIYLSIFIQMTINVTTKSLEVVEQNIDEMQEDVEEMTEEESAEAASYAKEQEDVDEIQEDVDEIQEDDVLGDIRSTLQKLMQDVEKLQSKQ